MKRKKQERSEPEKCFLNLCKNKGRHEKNRFSRFESKESTGWVILQARTHSPCVRLSKLQGTKSAQCVSLFSLQGSALSWHSIFNAQSKPIHRLQKNKKKGDLCHRHIGHVFAFFVTFLDLVSFFSSFLLVVCLDHCESCMNGRKDVLTTIACLEFLLLRKKKGIRYLRS